MVSVPSSLGSWEAGLEAPKAEVIIGDARNLPLPDNSVDLIVTSPPYWNKRDYGHPAQLGQEATPEDYVESLIRCLEGWRRVLTPTGSVFLNVGDSYIKRSLAGIPFKLEAKASEHGWLIRNRIIWAKSGGMPDPARNRLANRHEYILHFTPASHYYYDLFGYSEEYGNGSNPGDVWQFAQERNMGSHLAPFPLELARRCLLLGCPRQVCRYCNTPRSRVVERTRSLDPKRPQAARAMELAVQGGLTDEHIRAIQATGVSDVGKATRFQSGTGRNSAQVQRLAAEAKEVLGGYFREFTFAKKITTGWTDCGHSSPRRGVVLDPFVGTGTTLRAATELGFDSIGVDLNPVPGDF